MILRVFIGYDHVESVAYHVLSHSIQRRASWPISITPIYLKQLQGVYTRPRDPKQSNEFSFTRFLVPYLSGYHGYSVWMDSDVLCRTNLYNILDDIDPEATVSVVKHSYVPKDTIKYLGNRQYNYPCKNWSSVMVFNNAKCAKLTTDYVNTASPMDLHQFKWADDVGELGKDWNHLVGEVPENPHAKLVHFTRGMPLWPEFMDCEYSREWWSEFDDMKHWDRNVIYTQTVKKP